MYVIKRITPKGNTEWLCRDNSYRRFWRSFADKKWMLAFHNKVLANNILENTRAAYINEGFNYSIENIPYSMAELKYVINKPLDGLPDKDINYD